MTTITRTRAFRAAAIGSAALTAAALTAMPPASGAGKTKWITISPNVHSTNTTPSIARFGNTYEVIWVVDSSPSDQSIEGRILNAAGKPVGGVINVVPHWTGISPDPKILALGSQRVVAFGGTKTGSPGPYNNGAEYWATSTNGTKWTLHSGSLSANDEAESNLGADVINDAGTLITGIAGLGGVVYHIGTSPSSPAPGKDKSTQSTGDSATPGLGIDTKTHQVWALWYSNSGKVGKDGISAQVILPKPGKRILAPDSSANGSSQGNRQDLSAASRIGGGLYTAYLNPTGTAIEVWRVGTTKRVTVKDSHGPESIVLAAAPSGRLWLYWREFSGNWRAARSNKAATRFGPGTSLAVPHGAIEGNLLMAGNGSRGPLEAIGTYTTTKNANLVIARQVMPRLSITVSPHAVKRGHSFTAKVTDAGDPVKGATVHFGSVKKKTNKKGIAKIKVSHHTSLGKHAVTFTMSGYAAASTHIVIKK